MNLILQAIKALFRKVENSISQSVAKLQKQIDSVKATAKKDADKAKAEADKARASAETAQESANSKLSATDPAGTGSFSMNRRAGTKIGYCSHTEGDENTASGDYSHAEGLNTQATNSFSHAEGNGTKATGSHSHAEGYSATASGTASHAEGYSTNATYSYSHAEGNETTASNYSAHAEGTQTTAKGNSSHAEGNNTIAASANQHVQGKNNLEDSAGKYAHIVGNGANMVNRSNAHTLDWDGNAWFAGDVLVGGAGQSEGERLAKLSEIPNDDHINELIDEYLSEALGGDY